MPNLAQRFEAADRLLMHWHEQALGKPEYWASLTYSGATVPEMLRRVEVARRTGGAHAGTAQLFELTAFAEDLRREHSAPAKAEVEFIEHVEEGDGVEKTGVDVPADGVEREHVLESAIPEAEDSAPSVFEVDADDASEESPAKG